MRGVRCTPLVVVAAALALTVTGGANVPAGSSAPLQATAVADVGFTVSDIERAVAFYTGVLRFEKVSETEVAGREYELLTGVFGARARIARLRLGSETIELTEFLTPRGRPFPADAQSNDRIFQHIAIVVTDIDAAYRALRGAATQRTSATTAVSLRVSGAAPGTAPPLSTVEHGSTAPQRLPDWNPNAGGIKAFYFRDPDRHFLELIEFPPGKGEPRWQSSETLFAGIDHTAIVVEDTDASLRFYRDTLGLRLAGESENHGVEQEHLNNVFGARLRITALRAPAGPGIELLEYLAPRSGRPAPIDLRANDVAHWQTSVRVASLSALLPLARQHRLALVSPGAVDAIPSSLGFARGALVRDPDGHGVRLTH